MKVWTLAKTFLFTFYKPSSHEEARRIFAVPNRNVTTLSEALKTDWRAVFLLQQTLDFVQTIYDLKFCPKMTVCKDLFTYDLQGCLPNLKSSI